MEQIITKILSVESPVITQSTSHVVGNKIYIVSINAIHIFDTTTETFQGSITLADTTMKKSSIYYNGYIYILYSNPSNASSTNRKKLHIDRFTVSSNTYVSDYYTITSDRYMLNEYSQMLFTYTSSSDIRIRGFFSSNTSSSGTTQNSSDRINFKPSSSQGTSFSSTYSYGNSIVKKGQPFLVNDTYYLANSSSSGRYVYSIGTSGTIGNMTQVMALPSSMDTTLIKSFIYNGEYYLVDNQHFYKYNISGNTISIINGVTLPINLGECWANIVGKKIYFFNPDGQIVVAEFTEYNNTYNVFNNNGDINYYTTTDDKAPLSSVRFDYDTESKIVNITLNTSNEILTSSYTHTDSENSYLKGFAYEPNKLVNDIDLNLTKLIYETTSLNFYEVLGYYTNKFEILNNDGSNIYIETGSTNSELKKVKFTLLENGDVNVNFITSTKALNYTYTPIIPDGYELVGYSNTITSNVIVYNFDIEYDVNKDEDVYFYEVYNAKIPSFKGFGVVLYQNNSEKNRVDKSLYLRNIATIEGTLREQCNLINPILTIEYNEVPNFNYVFIPIFNRYYYVSDITNLLNGLWKISLQCDVLMSYKDIIKNQTAFIERQEFDYDVNVSDDIMPAISEKEIHTYTTENTFFYPEKVANENTNSFFRYLFGVVAIKSVE